MTPESITQWLQAPHTMPDTNGLEAMIDRYPYFVPARYLQAATEHKKEAFSPALLNRMPLYSKMQAATVIASIEATEEETIPAPAAEPIPEQLSSDTIIQPVFAEDYFRHQGIVVADNLPKELDHAPEKEAVEDPKSLMVVMSFSEWLLHFKKKTEKEKDEEQDRKAVRSMWQKEKLAAAQEEENDEIPENVFEMAVNSITKEDGLASESLAEILAKQGKYEQAIEMYKKLSLGNPQKNAYFAQQIAQIQKNINL